MSSRRGFTLIEVMLALALSAVVLALVSTAIDLHLRVLDSGRTKVEEARLARAVLRRIADDLRSTVQCVEEESPQAETDPEAAQSETTDPTAEDPNATDPTLLDPSLTEPDPVEEEPVDLAASEAPQRTPGLYGNLNQLQIDTSRLPRADQFGSVATVSDGIQGQVAGPISDVKTVTYYVNSEPAVDAINTIEPVPGGAGLVRREQDRATALWASDDMTLDPSASLVEPMAPEVAAIEFLYHDGFEWVEQWDSAQAEDLPKAVKITVWIIPVDLRSNDRSTLTEDDCMVYQLTVHLPMAGSGG